MSVNIWNATEQKLNQVGGNVNINDNVISEDSTFSSKKISDSLVDKADVANVAKNIYIKDTSSQDARILIQNHWNEFDKFEFYNLHIDTAKWAWDAEIYAHTSEYGTVLLRSYGSDVPSVFYGKLYNGVWTWQELATMDKVADIVKALNLQIKNSEYVKGMDLSSRITIPNGYKFLCWVHISSNGWIMDKPMYFAVPTSVVGYPYSDTMEIPTDQYITFTYLVVKS